MKAKFGTTLIFALGAGLAALACGDGDFGGNGDGDGDTAGDGDGDTVGDGDGDDNGDGDGDGDQSCNQGDEGCACFGNDTCNGSLSCLSGFCVDGNGDGDGDGDGDGTGGTSGSGDGDGDGTGGTPPGDGDGDGDGADTCGGANPATIDNFNSCDDQICNLGGRAGTWFNYADLLINDSFRVGIPGGTWLDQGCAAVHTGGAPGPANATFAGIGVKLLPNEGGYDVSSYTGIRVEIETADDVWLHITTTDGGHYGATVAGGTIGADVRDITFASMTAADDSAGTKDLENVTQVGIDAEDPESYGYALHRIEFY